jgi:hypothetical protein
MLGDETICALLLVSSLWLFAFNRDLASQTFLFRRENVLTSFKAIDNITKLERPVIIFNVGFETNIVTARYIRNIVYKMNVRILFA